jgi:hypothetical protein
VRRAGRKENLVPVFWTERELKASSDVFPVEFTDLKECNKVLYGRNVVAEIIVDGKNLRHQLEFELRSKLLRLRSEWFSIKDSKPLLAHFLGRAGTSFLYLFTHAQKRFSGKLEDALAEPFKKCVALKKKEIRLDRKGLQELYEDVHASVCRIVSKINDE